MRSTLARALAFAFTIPSLFGCNNSDPRDASEVPAESQAPETPTGSGDRADTRVRDAVDSDGFLPLQALPDEDDAEDRVEVSLTAMETAVEVIDGRPQLQQAYNGVIPGPLIRAKLGDTLIVKLKNELSVGTTIHWHGMRVPNGMDGVPGVTQAVIEPGDEFVYEFPLLDAGTFWYHPHFQTLEQVGNGLYGAVLVEEPGEEDNLGQERVLAVSDISLFEDGSVQHHAETDEIKVVGREGATLLLNGHPDQRMRVLSGTRQRFRVMNMARSRYLELRLAGHRFTQIGTDGGRMAGPIEIETVSMTPGERVDLIVEPHGEPGTHIDLVTLPVNRGPEASTSVGPEILLRLEFEGTAPSTPARLGTLTRELETFPIEDAQEVPVELTMDTETGELEMGINGIRFSESSPLRAELGVPQIWNVKNATAYSHPFHLHGFFFQVLTEDGFQSPLRLEDTIDIPPRETRRLVPRFDEDRPGMWMFHCHILDHAESGMMGVLNLSDDEVSSPWEDAGAPSTPDPSQTPTTPVVLGDAETVLRDLLQSEAYLLDPWVAETETPRARSSVASPHGAVKVYANEALLASLRKGNSVKMDEAGTLEFDTDAPPHDEGSIAVKEFYDGDERVGRAALMKLGGSAFSAAYYCDGPQSRCGVEGTPPVFGEDFDIGCGTCHAGFVYTFEFPL
jgi:FtsP/CotA-like multicopper oxidase with cupredoxin domain